MTKSSTAGHNSASQTHSRLPQCDSRPVISAEPAHHNRVESQPEVVKLIFRLWGTPVVDMFATVQNTHFPQFTCMSPVPEPRALVIDALSQDWQGRSMFMFPPFSLRNKVIQKLRTTQTGEVILIDPWWLSQLWFPHLHLCVDHPRFFPYRRDLLSQQGYISRATSHTICTHGGSHAALPSSRRPSTNRMHDDRWLCLALTWPQGKYLIHLVPQLLK